MVFPEGGNVAADGRFYGTIVERFWHYTDRSEGCWAWTGVRKADGYGRLCERDGTQRSAHRFAYELLVGPIPDGLVLDHLYRNPSCVNPAHLEPVTSAENVRRGVARCSKVTHCPKGHEYTEENTYRPPGRERRMCRACAKTKPGGSRYRQWRRAASTLEG